MLPNLGDIVCQVEFFNQAAATSTEEVISAADLGLLPIDLLYLVTLDRAPAMAALDDIILHHVVNTFTPRIDSEIRIQYTEPVADKVTFFELAPLIRSLRSCLLRSRPLRVSDIRLQGEAQKADDDSGAINVAKIEEVKTELQAALATWNTFVTTVSTTLTGADDETIISNSVKDIDQLMSDFIDAAQALTKFGIPAAGIGSESGLGARALFRSDEEAGRACESLAGKAGRFWESTGCLRRPRSVNPQRSEICPVGDHRARALDQADRIPPRHHPSSFDWTWTL